MDKQQAPVTGGINYKEPMMCYDSNAENVELQVTGSQGIVQSGAMLYIY